jgi:hypothetical protein
MPETINLSNNGLRSLAFVVGQNGVSLEVEKSLRYYLTGGPADNPAQFDDQSKIFFWHPRRDQLGLFPYELTVKDPLGQEVKKSVTINLLIAPSPEALPKGWDDFKLSEKYLRGRDYLPTTNIWEAEIASTGDYTIELKVTDTANKVYTLTYLPRNGNEIIDKNQQTATIMMGDLYRSERPKLIRRNLYEDLFNYLDVIFKSVEGVKISGSYQLSSFNLTDQSRATRAAEASTPKLNISFDDRYYEETLFSKKEPILISDTPVIKIDFGAATGLIWRRAKMVIDQTEYKAILGDFTTIVVKPDKKVSPFNVDYAMYMLTIPAVKKLPYGEHLISFAMEDAYGQIISREVYARVVTVPTQLQGIPTVFPNPFNPSHDSEVKIQYRLSQPAEIDLVMFSSDGGIICKKHFASGDEGGKQGINTITWNGGGDSGLTVSNGMYIGVIIDKGTNRMLDKFRITVFR